MRYLLTVEYFGKNYVGWQSQINGIAVQDVLNSALSKLLLEEIKTEGSGRTDAGVHAIGQAVHFDTTKNFPPSRLPMAVNSLLPKDIRVKKAEIVPDDFHVRYSAKKKTYIYKMYVSRFISPVRADTYVQVIPPIDVEKMKRATADLVGTHDFKAFSATGSKITDNTTRTIYSATLTENDDELIFTITGDGFLYNMVRIIVGTLVFIGKGKRPETAIKDMLATGDRTLGGKTFPAQGLYLLSVKY